jgi:hypothetical protein
MDANQKSPTERVPAGPEIQCIPLPAFNDSDLESVRRAFEPVARCPLRQAWQPEPSPHFTPAEVRVGWWDESLLVFAELTDADIHSSATELNQRMWELGDTFEMFLRPADQEPYLEFHVTPNNQRLQLRIANTTALRRAQAANEFDEFLLPGEVFHSTTWVQPERQRWFVFADIPTGAVSGQTGVIIGSRWHFSFSRYDYTRDVAEPVISSTSPHVRPDFHRQEEWGIIHFSPGRIG